MTRVLIADDLSLFRDGLELLLERVGVTVAGKARDGEELLRLAETEKPDVIITDIQMPVMDGIEATKKLRTTYPRTPVIALTQYDEEYLIADMLKAGAQGYLLKHSCIEEIVDALETVQQGFMYYCNETSKRMLELVARIHTEPVAPKPVLTDSDTAILRYLCQELSTKEIADQMHIGISTIDKYRARLMEKLGTRNVAGLVVYAIKHGIYIP
jgi:DNA-binding NarL/FixJ family response regulator